MYVPPSNNCGSEKLFDCDLNDDGLIGKKDMRVVMENKGRQASKIVACQLDYRPPVTYYFGNYEISINSTGDWTIRKYYPTIGYSTFEQDGSTFYGLTDHLASTSQILDSSGTIVMSYHYTPYGNMDTSNYPQVAMYTDKLFTGHQIDTSTGLYYFRARYYNPFTGTFISPDQLQGPNRYMYASNNPLKYTDPTGYGIGEFLQGVSEQTKNNMVPGGNLAGELGRVLHAPNVWTLQPTNDLSRQTGRFVADIITTVGGFIGFTGSGGGALVACIGTVGAGCVPATTGAGVAMAYTGAVTLESGGALIRDASELLHMATGSSSGQRDTEELPPESVRRDPPSHLDARYFTETGEPTQLLNDIFGGIRHALNKIYGEEFVQEGLQDIVVGGSQAQGLDIAPNPKDIDFFIILKGGWEVRGGRFWNQFYENGYLDPASPFNKYLNENSGLKDYFFVGSYDELFGQVFSEKYGWIKFPGDYIKKGGG